MDTTISTRAFGFVHGGKTYPQLMINWRRPKEGESFGPDRWVGEISIWESGSKKFDHGRKSLTVEIGQSAPLGSINFDLNPCGYGSMAGGSFSGHTITERDLQWATQWAVQALKHVGIWPGTPPTRNEAPALPTSEPDSSTEGSHQKEISAKDRTNPMPYGSRVLEDGGE